MQRQKGMQSPETGRIHMLELFLSFFGGGWQRCRREFSARSDSVPDRKLRADRRTYPKWFRDRDGQRGKPSSAARDRASAREVEIEASFSIQRSPARAAGMSAIQPPVLAAAWPAREHHACLRDPRQVPRFEGRRERSLAELCEGPVPRASSRSPEQAIRRRVESGKPYLSGQSHQLIDNLLIFAEIVGSLLKEFVERGKILNRAVENRIGVLLVRADAD